MRDIFDELAEEERFEVILPGKEPAEEDDYVSGVKNEIHNLSSKLNKYAEEKKKQTARIKAEFRDYIKSEIDKMKPADNVVERIIEKKIIEPRYIEPKVVQAPAPPPQIIKEVRVEVQTEKKDGKKYVEESKYLDLLQKVTKLETQLKETRRMAESPIVVNGGSGVIGIPPPEAAAVDHVLTVNANKKAEWKPGGGGASISGYTVTNPTTLKTIDLSSFTLDELGQLVGTLLTELQA